MLTVFQWLLVIYCITKIWFWAFGLYNNLCFIGNASKALFKFKKFHILGSETFWDRIILYITLIFLTSFGVWCNHYVLWMALPFKHLFPDLRCKEGHGINDALIGGFSWNFVLVGIKRHGCWRVTHRIVFYKEGLTDLIMYISIFTSEQVIFYFN